MSSLRKPGSADSLEGPLADVPPAVLFICSHNAARSIIAAALFNQISEGRARATSAGPHPAGAIATHAVAVLVELGIDVAAQSPRAITTADIHAADLVVTLTGVEDLPPLDGVRCEDWHVGGHTETLQEMRDLRDALSARVADLLARITRADSP